MAYNDNYVAKTAEEREQDVIDRLNNALEPKPIGRSLTMLWYILDKQKKKLNFIPNEKLTPKGVENSDGEIKNLQKAQDELTNLINKYK